ncbi:MAG: HAMP domain-containing protein [Acidobacteriia bacterium]|nr:HAMP domain-containing protein [Terriglobia bacterium]
MANTDVRIGSHFVAFRSVRNKLLVLMIVLSLLPLMGISVFSYFVGSRQIAEDRIQLVLKNKAQDTADKIDIMLRSQKQEVASMATTFSLIYPSLGEQARGSMVPLLNNFCLYNEVYDILAVLDNRGKIVAINTVNRFGQRLLSPDRIGEDITEYPAEKELFTKSIRGEVSQHDWYQSMLVQKLYDYRNEDVSYQYNVAFSEPMSNPSTHEIIGVWIGIINWSYIQGILDSVEPDLANQGLRTGYAFMYAKDINTIIGHKYRLNRADIEPQSYPPNAQNLYNTRIIQDHGLKNLHDAIVLQERTFAYEFPAGNKKESGIAPIADTSLGWIVGVGVDETDIFRPIKNLSWWLAGATLLLTILVVIFTFLVAQGITVPLKNLIHTAQTIAQGNLAQRVLIRSSDEVGILGATFNDMAGALEARENQLQELNRNLEDMVRQRTRELESSHEALKKAYLDLQNTQEQLVHTEKMASLGQLVAGIAHEIKNPLNFIYGNTSFLSDYTRKLQALLEAYDGMPSLSPEDRARITGIKESINYNFIREDLPTLIDNFTEGASRINNIVSDLRTFSRMDSYTMSEIDVHASIEISLNLLRNQYKERVEIHREYGEIPKVQGYSGKLSQVFMNLLSNAFHAIGDKGDVWIRTRAADGVVQVEIQDNGHGIPRENLKRIFEPFFTTKAVGQGTGLGLSISYGIVEQHHGRIFVANAPGGGSIFTVRLPIFQEKAEQ